MSCSSLTLLHIMAQRSPTRCLAFLISDFKSSSSLRDSLFPLTCCYTLSSHSQLNHRFFPNRSQWKQPVGAPDEEIILSVPAVLFNLDFISQQVVFNVSEREFHLAAWEGVWMSEWATRGREKKKEIIGDLIFDRLNERFCCQERFAVVQTLLVL